MLSSFLNPTGRFRQKQLFLAAFFEISTGIPCYYGDISKNETIPLRQTLLRRIRRCRRVSCHTCRHTLYLRLLR